MKKAFFILVFASLSSCKSIYSKLEATNQYQTFKSKNEYVEYFNKNYNLPEENIYFPIENEYYNFLSYIGSQDVDYFYGITLNSKEKIFDSFLNENNSCSGRVLNSIRSIGENTQTVGTNFFSYKFINIENQLLDSSEKLIIFLISPQLGKSTKKEIKKFSEDKSLIPKNFKIVYIAMDTPDIYN
ncbi:hypothetical protein E0W68_13595 [Flavobacterium salilacus subsp. salilacus]|uniref:hypothetical protein n=1 Tax=Flavobacterium TaxID=237 RepID=UPI001075410A|nr:MULTISPECIES: hypothetical protein [Flavobacterium]KAF2514502.1 hypothetical protein E0W68_13595 [Flavobacterium salilacus subsp. salilacus]MBE1615931.1 hypothetical protein [Flavobacterium sp. SaA2.13]